MKTRTLLAAAIACVALASAACATAAAEPATTTTMAMHAHDMEAMNMGDANATRADAIPDADLTQGPFAIVGDTPGDPAGTAWMARHANGTTVTITIDGLSPDTDHISHVHEATCAQGAGAHYRFDPEGGHHPPNEIHLAFTTDATGSGFMTAENHQVAGPSAVSVVVHEASEDAPKILCADLE